MPPRIQLAAPIIAILSTAGWQARANEHPLLAPTADVVVTYNLSGSLKQEASKVAISYHNASKNIRIDLYHFPDSNETFGSTLIDRTKKQMTVLFPGSKGYTDVPPGNAPGFAFMLNDQMKFKTLGYDNIAGQPCTNWEVGGAATACITKDGVLLRALKTGDKAGEMEATSVVYGPIPEATFLPPDDYREFVKVRTQDAPAATVPAPAAGPPNASNQPR